MHASHPQLGEPPKRTETLMIFEGDRRMMYKPYGFRRPLGAVALVPGCPLATGPDPSTRPPRGPGARTPPVRPHTGGFTPTLRARARPRVPARRGPTPARDATRRDDSPLGGRPHSRARARVRDDDGRPWSRRAPGNRRRRRRRRPSRGAWRSADARTPRRGRRRRPRNPRTESESCCERSSASRTS